MEEVKKTKKKNKVASLLLALALILTCGVAGTIAQYQRSLGGTGTAEIAKFSVNATNLSDSQSSKISLFDHVSDTASSQVDGQEKDVAQGTNGKLKIAPGTQGYFETALTNNSDVTVTYDLNVDLTSGTGVYSDTSNTDLNGKVIPLEFAYTDSEPTQQSDFTGLSWTKLTAGSTSLISKKDTLKMNNQDGEKNIYICWRWAFGTDGADDATNKLDTAIGEIISYLGYSSDGQQNGDANIALVPDNEQNLPKGLNPKASFKLPEATVTVKFKQVD